MAHVVVAIGVPDYPERCVVVVVDVVGVAYTDVVVAVGVPGCLER